MTRSKALEAIYIAGLEGDAKTFFRLYTENRISYEKAYAQFSAGAKRRKLPKLFACPNCGEAKHESPCQECGE